MLLSLLIAGSPHFLILSYSAKGKSLFRGFEKSVHLLAPCDHNCARRAHRPAFPDLFDEKTSPTHRRGLVLSSFPIGRVSLSSILHGE